jgi:hypothetical protein
MLPRPSLMIQQKEIWSSVDTMLLLHRLPPSSKAPLSPKALSPFKGSLSFFKGYPTLRFSDSVDCQTERRSATGSARCAADPPFLPGLSRPLLTRRHPSSSSPSASASASAHPVACSDEGQGKGRPPQHSGRPILGIGFQPQESCLLASHRSGTATGCVVECAAT